jgi:hypothetical protein
MSGKFLSVMAILVIGIAIYARMCTVYFCGYDDFLETHRANFEDTRAPTRIFTTTHFESTKYRPLNRLLTLVCWRLGDGSSVPFRLRNLIFHLIAAALVWGVALSLTRDSTVSLISGLLFCVHPMVNQNITAAIFTNTAAYAVLLASFLLFLSSLRSGGRKSLAASLILALIGLSLYESVIVIFGLMVSYLVLWRLQGRRLDKLWFTAWACGSAAVLVIFTAVRHFVITASNVRAPLLATVHNVLVYSAALLSPVDPVLSNAIFHSPLPPNIRPDRRFVIAAAIGAALFLVIMFAFLRSRTGRLWTERLNLALILFLVISIIIALGPVLVFAPHASETYLYLPVALYSILLSILLRSIGNRIISASVLVLLLLSFSAGTWIRNQRVENCGNVARRVMAELPTAAWKQGSWLILLANMPGASTLHRYGVYGYEGLGTIDPSEPGSPSAEAAVQNATGNERAKVQIVPPEELRTKCVVPTTCFQVSRDGTVHQAY